jgi:hypothetical protein
MVEAQLGKLRRGLGRLIDAYAEGLIEKGEFEPRIARLLISAQTSKPQGPVAGCIRG